MLLKKIEEARRDRLVISGLRTPMDVKTLRNRLGDAFTLVCVSVDSAEKRFRRAEKRNAPRDADTFGRFVENDKAEDRLFNLNQTLSMADIEIPNNGSLEEFHTGIEKNLADIL